MFKRRLVVIALLLPCCLLASFAGAEGQEQGQAPEVEVNIRGTILKIPDVVLRDQEGRKVRFYSDLIKDRVVVLSFFYTSCAYSCTLQGRTFSKLQSLLGERLGKSVFLISVTIDPATDDPAKLKAWSKRYDVQTGWTLVTGDVAEMNKLLKPFTGSTAGESTHLPATFIGNDKKGLWTSALGVFPAMDLLRAVDFMTR
jgi:protein SCO1/2